MNNEFFIDRIKELREASFDTLIKKNSGSNGYAKNSNDSIHNFVVGANVIARDKGTPAQAAWDYMTKHLVALRDKVINSDFDRLEDTKENCIDIINYISIIYAISCQEAMNNKEDKSDKDCKPSCFGKFYCEDTDCKKFFCKFFSECVFIDVPLIKEENQKDDKNGNVK